MMVDLMNTELGRYFKQHFPAAQIQEDDFGSNHYWVAMRLGDDQWISVEAFSEGDFGVSVVRDGELDFGGHDRIFNEQSHVTAYVADLLRTRADS
jgi:hypothetical protein